MLELYGWGERRQRLFLLTRNETRALIVLAILAAVVYFLL
jgi:hypothetical protein